MNANLYKYDNCARAQGLIDRVEALPDTYITGIYVSGHKVEKIKAAVFGMTDEAEQIVIKLETEMKFELIETKKKRNQLIRILECKL